jgi:hypothetical protein
MYFCPQFRTQSQVSVNDASHGAEGSGSPLSQVRSTGVEQFDAGPTVLYSFRRQKLHFLPGPADGRGAGTAPSDNHGGPGLSGVGGRHQSSLKI